MLLYHFGSKQRLLSDLLAYLAEEYAHWLDTAFIGRAAETRRDCLAQILDLTARPEAAPYLRVWWDIVAGAAAERSGFREAASQVMMRLLAWLERHMPAGDPDPRGGARYLLTIVEGAQMLRVVGCDDIAKGGIAALPASP